MLPGIHENTQVYSGQINPDDLIRFEFSDGENEENWSVENPNVSQEGDFTLNLEPFDVEAGQAIRVTITNGYPHERVFEIPVYEAKEGMEEIRVRE